MGFICGITKSRNGALTSRPRCAGSRLRGLLTCGTCRDIFIPACKRYNDACYQQEASARVDHAHMIRDRVLPDQIHNFAHNNEWLIRNLLNIGRVHDAVDLAKNMTELPQHPKYNTIGKRGSSAYYGRMRLFIALNQNEMWPEMIELCNSPYLEPTKTSPSSINA